MDTNVLLYTLDAREAGKRELSLALLDRLHSLGVGMLSVQVLGEFYDRLTRPLGKGLGIDRAAARELVQTYALSWPVLGINARVVLEALRASADHQVRYWDAQLWATAWLAQVPIILSEDLQSSPQLFGVKFVNPFASDFDVDVAFPLPDQRGRATSARGIARLRELLGNVKDVESLISQLPIEQGRVLALRFGLHDGRLRTQEQVATELGVSQATVGRLERSAFARLHKFPGSQPE